MSREEFFNLLKKDFPTKKAAAAEIINLRAILSLPKGTEYFFSDLHGEHEAFIYMLKSASGVIKEKIDWLFSKSDTPKQREELAELIYYPHLVINKKKQLPDYKAWLKEVIYKLIEVCKQSSVKYTRSKVRKKLPKGFDYIIDELLHAEDEDNKVFYYSEIINSLIETDIAEEFIKELSATISRLVVDRLHILGDLFDRGPHPDYIMDYLISYDNVDFQWGNHDIAWLGALKGNWAMIANVLRISIRYNNFDMLEIGYGINLRPLSAFASLIYHDDPCERFTPQIFEQNKFDPVDSKLAAKMHKAISVIQFKLEQKMAKLFPVYKLDNKTFFDCIDFNTMTAKIDSIEYPLLDTNFPTVNPLDTSELTEEEEDLMKRLSASFTESKQLKKHIEFMLSHGSLYKAYNGNLLYHGCIPMTKEGEFEEVEVKSGVFLKGKEYFDYLDRQVRKAYFSLDDSPFNNPIICYLWSGRKSPLFGKDKITTFERYFIADKKTHHESIDCYYSHINKREICEKILLEFGLNNDSHIINGHVPVKSKDGESPVKAQGKLFIIDGGMAKSFQKTTGIAGYTLIFNSRYLAIAEHKPFDNKFYHSPKVQIIEYLSSRMTVGDSDIGREIKKQIKDLEDLIEFSNNSLNEYF